VESGYILAEHLKYISVIQAHVNLLWHSACASTCRVSQSQSQSRC